MAEDVIVPKTPEVGQDTRLVIDTFLKIKTGMYVTNNPIEKESPNKEFETEWQARDHLIELPGERLAFSFGWRINSKGKSQEALSFKPLPPVGEYVPREGFLVIVSKTPPQVSSLTIYGLTTATIMSNGREEKKYLNKNILTADEPSYKKALEYITKINRNLENRIMHDEYPHTNYPELSYTPLRFVDENVA